MSDIIIASGLVTASGVYTPTSGQVTRYHISLSRWKIDGDTRGFLKEAGDVIKFNARQQPMKTIAPYTRSSISTLLQCAGERAIPYDWMLIGTTVRVALRKAEFQHMRPGNFMHSPRTVDRKELILTAVEINPDQMLANYDKICKMAFGESWPEWFLRTQGLAEGDAP